MKQGFLCILLSTWVIGRLIGQSISMNLPVLEDFMRRTQLIEDRPYQSFALRPIYVADTLLANLDALKFSSFQFGEYGKLAILPIQTRVSFNSHHPISQNDGSNIPSRGWQNSTSFGLYAEHKFFKMQIRPEHVYAENTDYDGFPFTHNDHRWTTRHHWWNLSDHPEQFGDSAYKKWYLGQSHFKFYFRNIEMGISSENLWWGPGKRNALILSDNSPGFPHITINSILPISTKIGSFEGQVLGGILRSSGFPPIDTAFVVRKIPLLVPKNEGQRYFNGINISYQPKWIQGLFLGFINTSQQYLKTAKDRSDYLPVLTDIFKYRRTATDLSLRPDKYFSVYGRYVWMPGKIEIFGSVGNKSDQGLFHGTYFVRPAYNFGFTKMVPLKKENRFIEISTEITQLAQQNIGDIRAANSWYISNSVRQGHTNQGQWLGAGIGPGSNSQYLSLSWINNIQKVGINCRRILHNNDWYYYTLVKGRDFRSTWADFSFGLFSELILDQIIIESQVSYIRSFNYQWELVQGPNDPYYTSGTDVNNLSMTFNIAYVF